MGSETNTDPCIGRATSSSAGIFKDENGYWRRSLDNRLIHRAIYYKAHKGTPGIWHVHHINGDKEDNRLENLIALPGDVHLRLHCAWPMSGLPSREQIEDWFCGLKRGFKRSKCKKKKKNKSPKAERRERRRNRRVAMRHYLATGIVLEEMKNDQPFQERLAELQRQRIRNLSQEQKKKVGNFVNARSILVRQKNGQTKRVILRDGNG